MNREIKFRGKWIDNGRWVYGDLIQYQNGETAILNRFSKYGYEATEICKRDKVDPKTVGQYTGLKDKNGKEIYEGDIVNHNGTNGNAQFNPVMVICFADGAFCIKAPKGTVNLDNDKVTIRDAMFEGKNHIPPVEPELEVIGNIHDNTELLEGSK